MSTRLMNKCESCIVAKHRSGCLFGCNQKERVSRELDILMSRSAPQNDSMGEQLKRCPDAYKAGELMEKIFEEGRFGVPESERAVPPAGAVLPPLV